MGTAPTGSVSVEVGAGEHRPYGECRREDKLNKLQLPSALADGLKDSTKQTPSQDFRKYEKPGRGVIGRMCTEGMLWH